MFDARDRQNTAGSLGFGLAVAGLVAGLFFTILQFPSLTGAGKFPVKGSAETEAVSSGVIEATFSDEATLDYTEKLRRTFPAAASDLEREIRRAVDRGANEVELGLIVLQAGTPEIASSLDRLSKADVDYPNRIIDLTSSQLNALNRSGAPYCMGDDLMMFAGLSQQELYRAVFDRVGHGAGLYEYALAINGILLDAIHDARLHPVLHSRLGAPDQGALQQLGFALMTNPQLVQLLTTEGKSRSEMDAVLAETNFCELGTKLISQLDTLPDTTKGRLWGEALRQIESGRWRYTLYRYTGY
ncbi:MAG: hypothetical protein RIB03_09075 [Henriciella sp.]|uniref:hypothetical protein n=1 Tax=Henriciella sp. TaxID=1968823 RepID=UPI0032EB4BB8